MFDLRVVWAISGLVLASACAPKEKDHVELFQVDSDFLPYVQNFELASSQESRDLKITDLIVSFGDTPNLNETGVCEITENETPRIIVNAAIWQTLSSTDRQEVIFHELGHCVLRRIHQNSQVAGTGGMIPDSIMYPYRISGTTYQSNISYYHHELFSKSGQF